MPKNKDLKKVRIPKHIWDRLFEKKIEDRFARSVEEYIIQILEVVSRK